MRSYKQFLPWVLRNIKGLCWQLSFSSAPGASWPVQAPVLIDKNRSVYSQSFASLLECANESKNAKRLALRTSRTHRQGGFQPEAAGVAGVAGAGGENG